MPREIAFDYDTAVERATRLFWRDGYAGTSLRDLLQAMNIGQGSFYNTLKSKKDLYLQCLSRYRDTEGRKRGSALESAPTASAGIRALFGAVLDCIDDPQTPSRLCMMAAMASDDVLTDSDLRKVAEAGLASLADRLTARLVADKAAGRLPESVDTGVVVPILVTYLQGLWRMAMVDYDRARFERQIDVLLEGLGL